MNQVLKWGLIAGATWFLFKDQIAAMFGSHPAAQPPPEALAQEQPPAQEKTQTGVTPSSAATTKEKLLAWAQANDFYKSQGNMLNAWQWNYGYHAVRGSEPPAPDVMFPNQDAARLMTLDEYWTGLAGAGLSGVRRSAAARAWRY